jgi:outer membrane lipopolysaccharide assembly protein LptE/RlpB
MQKYRILLGNAPVEKAIRAALEEAISEALRRTKQKTPVMKGVLRNGWKVTSITKKGDSWEIWLYNDVKYAPYVEYGHRTRMNNKTGMRKGFVKGQYMMKLSCDEVARDMDKIVQKHIKEMLAEMGFK